MATVDYPHISLDSASVPTLTGTRIKVVEIVLDHLAHGSGAEEIQRQFPHLTLGQIHSALAYYYDHQEEVDGDIARRLHKVGGIQSRLGDSPLARRLKGVNV
ncbi:MAG: DUF433 domain-containing protein [Thermoguttaceae bacterium]|jgi:uncharacterized protein (DUF433 family)